MFQQLNRETEQHKRGVVAQTDVPLTRCGVLLEEGLDKLAPVFLKPDQLASYLPEFSLFYFSHRSSELQFIN